MVHWEPNNEEHRLASAIAAGIAAATLILCLSILSLAFFLFKAGRLANRASLILLLGCLAVLSMQSAIYMAIINAKHKVTCSVSMYLYTFCTVETACLVFHILINTLLGIHSSKYARYKLPHVSGLFVGFSLLLTLLWGLVGHNYFWKSESQICWFVNNDDTKKMARIFAGALPVAIISITVFILLALIAYKMIWSIDVQHASKLHDQLYKPFSRVPGDNLQTEELRSSIVISSRPLSSQCQNSDAPLVLVARLPTVQPAIENQYYSDRRQLRQMVFRISVFPILYLFATFVIIALRMIYQSSRPFSNSVFRILYFVDIVAPLILPWCGALCALFADPTLSQAIMKFLFPSYTVDQGFDLEDQKTRFANELLSGGPGVSKQTMVNVVEEDELEFSETPKTHIVEVAEEKPSNHKSLEKNLASFAYKENMTTLDVVAEVEEG